MSGQQSQLSRYGAISRVLPNLAASARSFFVLNNSTTVPSWLSGFLNDFGNDSGGVPRVYSTVALAVAACTAGRGDIIYVLPNHTENISSATALNINIAGVRIQGMGEGNNRPVLTLTTATTAIITMSAANCTIDNVIIDGTGFASVVTIMTVTAAGCTISNNRIINATATNQAGVSVLTTAAASNLSILNNFFDGSANAGTTNALQLVGGNDIQIRGNTFIGNYTTSLGPINNITTGVTNLVIENNYLVNGTASSTKLIVLVSGSTGIISRNRGAILSGTAAVTAAGMFIVDNVYVSAVSVNAVQTQM